MDWTLEVVPVPVSDVDGVKTFYAGKVGFEIDHDSRVGEMRVVQLTPRGVDVSEVHVFDGGPSPGGPLNAFPTGPRSWR